MSRGEITAAEKPASAHVRQDISTVETLIRDYKTVHNRPMTAPPTSFVDTGRQLYREYIDSQNVYTRALEEEIRAAGNQGNLYSQEAARQGYKGSKEEM